MFPSKKIGKSVVNTLNAIKKDPGREADLLVSLKENYMRSLPRWIPRELCEDLFLYGWDKTRKDDRTYILGDLADLICQQYDEHGDPLQKEDWEFLAELMEDYDKKLEIELLQYLMIRIVDHGGLE